MDPVKAEIVDVKGLDSVTRFNISVVFANGSLVFLTGISFPMMSVTVSFGCGSFVEGCLGLGSE